MPLHRSDTPGWGRGVGKECYARTHHTAHIQNLDSHFTCRIRSCKSMTKSMPCRNILPYTKAFAVPGPDPPTSSNVYKVEVS
eukprot:1413053-Amphidinium_carterae.1